MSDPRFLSKDRLMRIRLILMGFDSLPEGNIHYPLKENLGRCLNYIELLHEKLSLQNAPAPGTPEERERQIRWVAEKLVALLAGVPAPPPKDWRVLR